MVSSLTFGIEPWDRCQADIAKLCVRHWEEIAHNRDFIKLDPDWQKYANLAKAGMMSVTCARDGSILAGYQIYVVMPHMHYKSSLTALSDVLYLAPEYRQGSAGIRLMKAAEEELVKIGVQRVVQNVKISNDWSPILTRMGYKEFERIYTKILRK